MKRYTVYFRNDDILSKAVAFPFLTLKLLLKTAGHKLISSNTSGKLKTITFDAEKRPNKSDLAVGKNQIMAIVSHDQGLGRYTRKGIVKKASKRKPRANMAQPLTPQQVAKAYGFPEITPEMAISVKQQCIALVELGGSINSANIASYCKKMGIAAPNIQVLCVNGAEQSSDGPDGADGEVSLDACIPAALLPGVTLLVIFAPNSDAGFIDAINAAIQSPLKPCAISISWGSPERNWVANVRLAMDVALQEAQEKGINIFVAAGDNGSSDGASGNNVDYPASSPFSIACGGTLLVLNADGSRQVETVWGENGATGGGVSIFYPRPEWQFNIPNQMAGRLLPDIAGNASPDSGYLINVDGEDMAVGGTSGVAPLMAALCVLLTALQGAIGNMTLAMYGGKTVFSQILQFFDVVQGSNGKYSAKVGFDLCSGLGVPDGVSANFVVPPAKRTCLQKIMSKLGLK